MRGRKPKPTALHVLHGNPGKRALPPDEPTPPVVTTMPAPPRRLGAWGRAQWRAQIPTLAASRVLTVSDLLMLEQLCATAEELVGLGARLSRAQRAPTSDDALLLRLHAAIDRKAKVAVALEAEFGLSPSSRRRVKTEKAPGIQDKLGSFLKARPVPSA